MRNCVCRALGWIDLITRSLPHVMRMWSELGPHASAYVGDSNVASVERSMPERDHTLTNPSSPAVATAVPS